LRVLLTTFLASLILGSSALGLNAQARDLLVGMFEDVGAILKSFAGGPDDPNSPVTNSATLKQDAARLDSATHKANQLAAELDNLRGSWESRGP
jgi:hypothetical protein